MSECTRAMMDFENSVDEAFGHLQMVVEPYQSRLSPAVHQRLQVVVDAFKQATLDIQAEFVAVMMVEATG